jgi:hypothetical protein
MVIETHLVIQRQMEILKVIVTRLGKQKDLMTQMEIQILKETLKVTEKQMVRQMGLVKLKD